MEGIDALEKPRKTEQIEDQGFNSNISQVNSQQQIAKSCSYNNKFKT